MVGILVCLLAGVEVISCPGEYGGHLQGIAVGPDCSIYWVFTTQLVKTDAAGTLLVSTPVPSHHGDPAYARDTLYVPVNLGLFNEEGDKADSWIYVYHPATLELLERHPLPEVVYGAGATEWFEGHFYVVGGLPKGHTQNYVYEYAADFSFVTRHVLESGYTLMGIQTISRGKDRWWYGCYGDPRLLMETGNDFAAPILYKLDYSTGIAPWKEGTFLRGDTERLPGKLLYTGRATVTSLDHLEPYRPASPAQPIEQGK